MSWTCKTWIHRTPVCCPDPFPSGRHPVVVISCFTGRGHPLPHLSSPQQSSVGASGHSWWCCSYKYKGRTLFLTALCLRSFYMLDIHTSSTLRTERDGIDLQYVIHIWMSFSYSCHINVSCCMLQSHQVYTCTMASIYLYCTCDNCFQMINH